MRRQIRFSLALLWTVAPLAAAPQRVSPATPDRAVLVARLDSLTQAFLAEGPRAGVTVAVIRGSDTLLLRGAGERDRERHLPATTTTVYQIGSITKQFTAAAVMQLVEQHRIALTDPLTKYLPQYPQWSAVTIQQLLDHTSGIHSYSSSTEWRRHWSADVTPAQLLDLVARDTFDFAPGTQWRYDNSGYVLLGLILERVTGRPYGELMIERFFRPLGMRTASYCPTRAADTLSALGYLSQQGALVPAIYLSTTHWYAAGALCMSVPDFLRWQTALTGGGVVSAASFARMSTSDSASGEPTRYGFGLALGRLGAHRFVWHDGGVSGFSSDQLWFPDDSLRVVAFTNTESVGAIHPFATNLAAVVLGLPLLPTVATPTIVALPAADRDRFIGTYDIATPAGRTLVLHVFADGTGLGARAEGPGQSAFSLLYYGNNLFGAEFDRSLRLRFVVDDGHTDRVVKVQRGVVMEGAKRP